VGLHLPPAARRGRGYRKPDQRRAQAVMAIAAEHGQPVALPPARRLWHRVEPDRAARHPVKEPDHVHRRRVVVMEVPVPALVGARALEQALLHHEDLVTDPEVCGELRRGGYRLAGQPGRPGRPASGC
jgi:hypothetical protein